jgi:hypothetical protein
MPDVEPTLVHALAQFRGPSDRGDFESALLQFRRQGVVRNRSSSSRTSMRNGEKAAITDSVAIAFMEKSILRTGRSRQWLPTAPSPTNPLDVTSA